ncbi:MAG TPA: dockerin type I repeat-containing protein [Acidobacteriota bacterium]|nr:dockerin type I repeat-containing protein [Acidobacteriota bacterium]
MTLRHLFCAIALSTALAAPVTPVQAGEGGPADRLAAIAADYEKGTISLDEKAILQITAITDPSQLPPEYRDLDVTGGRPDLRGATLVILEIRRNWDQLSPAAQSIVSAALDRPIRAFTFDSPSGFFKLHYDTEGAQAVPTADNDGDGVPDYIERCASYCDTTLQKHVELGYLLPPADTEGGDDKYDVYFKEMGYYGYTVGEADGPEPWDDLVSYIVVHRNFIGFPPNTDPEGNQAGAAKVTVAHEFHHAVQYAYNGWASGWFMEVDATYMEDIVFDNTNDNLNYLPEFFDYPGSSLMEFSMHSYASFIWGLYVAQRFDTSLMVSTWEGARYDDVFQALSDSLQANYGWTADSAFGEFATWNYITGYRDDGLHHEEASTYPLMAIGATHSSYPMYMQTSPTPSEGYSACYIRFLPGTFEGNLRIEFDGANSRDWAAYIIKSLADDQHEVEKMVLDPSTEAGTIDVYDFDSYQTVTLVGVNVSEYSLQESFLYRAELFGDFACSSVVLTTDGAVYSGAARDFEYQVYNTAPVNDVFDIISWDEAGWITPDTVDRFVSAGDSVVVPIPVHPPMGTPLGQSSTLHFKVVSKNDPNVFHQQDLLAITSLQRGDVNFDGLVDVGDLTYLIRYLFISGPDPVPVAQAGDFDCLGDVDVGDLTAMIRYLFVDGTPCPCNPF